MHAEDENWVQCGVPFLDREQPNHHANTAPFSGSSLVLLWLLFSCRVPIMTEEEHRELVRTFVRRVVLEADGTAWMECRVTRLSQRFPGTRGPGSTHGCAARRPHARKQELAEGPQEWHVI